MAAQIVDQAGREIEARAHLVGEVVGEPRDVVGALAQRRHHRAHHGEAVVQVLAEGPLLDHVLEVAVGGGHHADVDPGRARVADAPHLALLQHAEELRLQLERELADLVEEEGAAVGRLDQAVLVGVRAGERALDVAEQLRADQVGRDRRAVDHGQGVAGAVADPVHRLGDRLLAGPGLALEQERGVGRRHSLQQREQVAHDRRHAEHASQPVVDEVGELDRALAGHDLDAGVASDAQPGGAMHGDGGDPGVAVEGAVGRVQVLDLEPVAPDLQLQVIARHGVVGEDEVVVRVRPDHDRPALQQALEALVGSLHDREAELALSQLARRDIGIELSGREVGRIGHRGLRVQPGSQQYYTTGERGARWPGSASNER
jgi:hypothetical protein